ncbi:hypothetical protein HGI15_01735 [Modestobacter lapidis]|nr:hypothetical protein [Modestobacter lapidis]
MGQGRAGGDTVGPPRLGPAHPGVRVAAGLVVRGASLARSDVAGRPRITGRPR